MSETTKETGGPRARRVFAAAATVLLLASGWAAMAAAQPMAEGEAEGTTHASEDQVSLGEPVGEVVPLASWDPPMHGEPSEFELWGQEGRGSTEEGVVPTLAYHVGDTSVAAYPYQPALLDTFLFETTVLTLDGSRLVADVYIVPLWNGWNRVGVGFGNVNVGFGVRAAVGSPIHAKVDLDPGCALHGKTTVAVPAGNTEITEVFYSHGARLSHPANDLNVRLSLSEWVVPGNPMTGRFDVNTCGTTKHVSVDLDESVHSPVGNFRNIPFAFGGSLRSLDLKVTNPSSTYLRFDLDHDSNGLTGVITVPVLGPIGVTNAPRHVDFTAEKEGGGEMKRIIANARSAPTGGSGLWVSSRAAGMLYHVDLQRITSLALDIDMQTPRYVFDASFFGQSGQAYADVTGTYKGVLFVIYVTGHGLGRVKVEVTKSQPYLTLSVNERIGGALTVRSRLNAFGFSLDPTVAMERPGSLYKVRVPYHIDKNDLAPGACWEPLYIAWRPAKFCALV
jgi:hypothetical protein